MFSPPLMESTSSANPFLKSLLSCLAELEGKKHAIPSTAHHDFARVCSIKNSKIKVPFTFARPPPKPQLCLQLICSLISSLTSPCGPRGRSRVRLGLQRQGTYLVVELERRPSTPAGALTAFMGAMGNGSSESCLSSYPPTACTVEQWVWTD
jgi:hypothetical protein